MYWRQNVEIVRVLLVAYCTVLVTDTSSANQLLKKKVNDTKQSRTSVNYAATCMNTIVIPIIMCILSLDSELQGLFFLVKFG